MLCIKPASESNGTGVARLQSPQELCSFCWALRQRPLTIPEHIFAAAHPPVPMRPGRPPSRYVVEPFIATDGCGCRPAGAMRPCCCRALQQQALRDHRLLKLFPRLPGYQILTMTESCMVWIAAVN